MTHRTMEECKDIPEEEIISFRTVAVAGWLVVSSIVSFIEDSAFMHEELTARVETEKLNFLGTKRSVRIHLEGPWRIVRPVVEALNELESRSRTHG